MYHDLKQIYFWDGMKKDISEYVAKRPNCQQVKEEYIKTGGKTQIIEVQTWKQEAINMDMLVGIPRTRRQHDSIQIIMDRLTKSTNFIPVKSNYKAEDYA